LSFLPESRSFGTGGGAASDSSFEMLRNGIGLTGSHMLTHAELLKQRDPWRFLRSNGDISVELNVHGNRRYEQVLLDRVAKYEKMVEELEATKGANCDDDDDDLLVSDQEIDTDVSKPFL